jgi:uncharacterized membrane protein
MVTLIVPLTVIVLAVPMILEKIPRNPIYGFRTKYTMSSDEVWYRANRIAGVAMLVAGTVWLILGAVLPNLMASTASANRLIVWSGSAILILAIAVSFWLTYKT